MRRVCESAEGSVFFVVSPTEKATSMGRCWREFFRYCPRVLVKDYPKGIHRTPGNRYVEIVGNRFVYFKSADRPDACRGEALAGVWLDEPADMKGEVWDQALLPSLMDVDGVAWFTGTPKGRNWYYRECLKGLDPLNSEYKTWQFSSYGNTVENGGYLRKEAIDAVAAAMSELARRQEIYAEFLEGLGVVFRDVDRHVRLFDSGVRPDGQYASAADLGKSIDFTVLGAADVRTGEVHGFERFGEISWPFQRSRLKAFAKRFNDSRMLIDSSGLGDPIYDELRSEGARVDGYKFTHATKLDLIENLSIMLDNDELWLPGKPAEYDGEGKLVKSAEPLWPEAVNELKSFGYEISEAGVMTYRAPEGLHDDCVIMLALLAWQLKKRPQVSIGILNW